jgi:hypothetical protein
MKEVLRKSRRRPPLFSNLSSTLSCFFHQDDLFFRSFFGITRWRRRFKEYTAQSSGRHYGPAFYNYFYDQYQMIANGTAQGIQ